MKVSENPRLVAQRKKVNDLFASGLTGTALAEQIGVTPRGIDVLKLTAQGMSAAEAGEKLGITEDTVKTHKRRTSIALGSDSGVRAVAMAYKLGILQAFVSKCPSCGWKPGQRTEATS